MRAGLRNRQLKHPGARLLAAASMAALSLLILSCGASNTVDFLYVTSNLQSPGQINVYEVNSESGAIHQIADSPYPSGGRNPVYEVASPNGLNLYVANHDDNTIVEYAIGTDGKLYPLTTVNTPGTEPVALAVNSSGTALYVLDYYAPAAPGQPSYTDLNPGPGALIVYPINPNGLSRDRAQHRCRQLLPRAVLPHESHRHPQRKLRLRHQYQRRRRHHLASRYRNRPHLPASCPSSGTVSAFSVTSSAVTPVAGSPFSTGSASEPTGILADPASASLYVTDSAPQPALHLFDSVQRRALPGLHRRHRHHAHGRHHRPGASAAFLYVTNLQRRLHQHLLPQLRRALPRHHQQRRFLRSPLRSCRPQYPSLTSTPPTTSAAPSAAPSSTPPPEPSSPTRVPLTSPSGQPTCVAAITHAGGNKNGL